MPSPRRSREPSRVRPPAAQLRRRLIDWYDAHRRDLPWRRTSDPYAIWISEAMLQQTRVETVKDYWQRFLARFPDVSSLARASEDEVLAVWSGLGYYRRARALHEAAREVVARHGGAFPRRRSEVLALPGVGPYTAGAVLSIAFDEPEPVVDGNVARVFSRLFGLEAPLGSSVLERELWALARELVPPRARGARGPGAWNQALMELGATLCTARDPRCLLCPLREPCVARREGRSGELPRPARRPAPVDVELEALWVRRGTEVLVQRRPAGGRMAGLWELPTRERTVGGGPPRLFPARFATAEGGLSLEPGEVLGELRHGITHHRIRLSVRAGRAVPGAARERGPRAAAEGEARWTSLGALAAMPQTGMTRKALRSSFLRSELEIGAGS